MRTEVNRARRTAPGAPCAGREHRAGDRRGRRPGRSRRAGRGRAPGADRGAQGRSPSWRTAGGGRWPTWTTSANASPGTSSGRGADERARAAAEWLPVLDNLERALEHAGDRSRRRSSKGSGRSGTRRRTCWPVSASRAVTTSVRRSTRPGTRRSAVLAQDDAPTGTVVRGAAARLRRRRAAAATGAGGGGQGPELMAAGRDFYEVLGRAARREPGGDPARLPQAGPRPTTPTSTRTRPPRSGSRRSPRRTTCCPTRTTRRRYDAFGADFRQVPDDVDPETWARARTVAGPAHGRRRARPGTGGLRRRLRRGRRPRGPARRHVRRPRGRAGRGWGPIPGADQEAEIELTVEEAYRGGRRIDHAVGPTARARWTSTIPAGRDRRAAHPAGRAGRQGRRRRRRRRPLPGRPDRAAPPLPGRGPRPARRPAAGTPWEAALGRSGRGRHPGRRGQGQGARRARPAAGGCGCAAAACPTRAGKPGDLYAEVQDHGAAKLTEEERRLFEQLAAVSTFDPRRRSMTILPHQARRVWTWRRSPGPPARIPDLVRRLVVLGVLEATARRRRPALVPAARAAGHGAGSSACARASPSTTPRSGSWCDLLDRIAELEAALRDRSRPTGGSSWT